MVYFIICKIHGFPHQFPLAWENAVKSVYLGEPRKLAPIFSLTFGYFSSIRFPWNLFPYYGRFFSVRFPFYGILHHMGNAFVFSIISHNMGKDSQTHRMGKVWEIGSRKYPTKPILCGEPGNWYSYFSHSMGAFSY